MDDGGKWRQALVCKMFARMMIPGGSRRDLGRVVIRKRGSKLIILQTWGSNGIFSLLSVNEN